EAKQLRERLAIHLAPPAAMGAQRLELRAEDESIAELPVVERLLAEAVACERERALVGVPECEGKHSAAALQRADEAPFLDGSKQYFRVAAAAKARAMRAQLGAQSPVVIDLAVVGDREAPARGAHRLGAERRQIDDREAAVAERHRRLRIQPESLVVRPAMAQRGRHRRELLARPLGREAAAEKSSDAAHAP